MITEPITKVSSRLNDYIAQCKLLGFKNNETLELMKELIDKKLLLLKTMQDTAKRTQVKGFNI